MGGGRGQGVRAGVRRSLEALKTREVRTFKKEHRVKESWCGAVWDITHLFVPSMREKPKLI